MSGAGKSTILSLLLRFYEPNAGAVLLDGRDTRTITQESLRGQIGIVTQDTFLFHDSIMNNIRYGRLDATEEEVVAAAKAANMRGAAIPDGRFVDASEYKKRADYVLGSLFEVPALIHRIGIDG